MSLSNLLKRREAETVANGTTVIPVSYPIDVSNGSSRSEEDESCTQAQERLLAVERECDLRLSQTEVQCGEIIAAAEQRAGDIEESARQSGFQSGYKEGQHLAEEEMRRQWSAKIEQVASYLKTAESTRIRMLLESDKVLTFIAMEAVRKLLHRELTCLPADVNAMVAEMLQYLSDSTHVEVRVHPDDFLSATEAHPTWKSGRLGEWELVVIPDEHVTPGGCELRSAQGRADATLETKLELLETALADIMERSVKDVVETELLRA